MTSHLVALLLGALLDLLLGDPAWAPHPVRAIGRLISTLERLLRRLFPATPRGELAAGALLTLLVLVISTGLTVLFLWLAGLVSPWLRLALETLLSYQCLAARSLRDESMKVFSALTGGALGDARRAVSMIVGRDTDRLDEAGVARAAVETVAENCSDGVIAPLLFLAIGGAPLGIFYKAANTMDSMIAYRNDRYLYLGRWAAKLDDILNFLPARLSGILMCLAAPLVGQDGRNAWRIFWRDRRKHKSPNAAHTEAAAAGALHVRLNGPNWYFGQLVDKPYLGDDDRPVVPDDIRRANRLMFATAFLSLLLFCIVPLVVLTLW